MKHHYCVLSPTKKCSVCGKPLKLRIAEDKPTASLCYRHYRIKEARRGHLINNQPRKSRLVVGLPTKNYRRNDEEAGR